MVLFLTASYDAAWREMFLDDYLLPFDRRTTIGSLVLVSCASVRTIVWRDILLIYSALGTEDTCMEAANTWALVVK